MDSSVNVETENGCVHVETQNNNQGTSHVGTTVDQPVMLHVHVETMNIVSSNTESVEPANTQGPVQKLTDAKQQSMLLPTSKPVGFMQSCCTVLFCRKNAQIIIIIIISRSKMASSCLIYQTFSCY